METRKQKIQKILDMSKKINPSEVSNKEGNLDFEKMEKNKINQEQIRLLKEMKVDFEELREKGFMLGAMVLGRYLK